jgi:hypothetical protein
MPNIDALALSTGQLLKRKSPSERGPRRSKEAGLGGHQGARDCRLDMLARGRQRPSEYEGIQVRLVLRATAMVAFGSRHSWNLHHSLQTSRNPDLSYGLVLIPVARLARVRWRPIQQYGEWR